MWKDIPGYEGKYEQEEETKSIRNKRTGCILRAGIYSRERICSLYDILGEKKTFNINTLWKLTFGGGDRNA